MRVYFAEPIDFDNLEPDELALRERIMMALRDGGHVVYRPSAAWDINGPLTEETARAIEGTNRQALRRSDVMVARLPESTVSHGVPSEIEFATRHQGIPCIVIGVAGVTLMANPMVHVTDTRRVHRISEQVDLLGSLNRNTDYQIRYSSPNKLGPAHRDDAGIDLFVTQETVVGPGTWTLIPTDTQIELPSGTFGWVVARSSTMAHFGLFVLPGIIDVGYTGEIALSVFNPGKFAQRVGVGDRLGQMLILPNLLAGFEMTQVEPGEVHINQTSRGSNGFGSTGR